MTSGWDDARRAFGDAAAEFVRTVDRVGDGWDGPGLGEWDVRSLVGHASRSLLTVETYLARPATVAEVGSTVEYYRRTRALAAGPDVAARGREAGLALGGDPARALAGITARVLPLLAHRDGTELLTTIAGGMRLVDYLPTRTFELVVHTADLAVALGLSPQAPRTAAVQAMRLAADLAVADERAVEVLLALTGRRGLSAGFSLL